MIYHEISWYIMRYHEISWYIMIYHDSFSQDIMIYHDISWYLMISHDISDTDFFRNFSFWNDEIMIYHDFSWDIMISHDISESNFISKIPVLEMMTSWYIMIFHDILGYFANTFWYCVLRYSIFVISNLLVYKFILLDLHDMRDLSSVESTNINSVKWVSKFGTDNISGAVAGTTMPMIPSNRADDRPDPFKVLKSLSESITTFWSL